ncbi:hypothetical protein GEMRC1_008582 [Eukaryota sp. GEM-RC1]
MPSEKIRVAVRIRPCEDLTTAPSDLLNFSPTLNVLDSSWTNNDIYQHIASPEDFFWQNPLYDRKPSDPGIIPSSLRHIINSCSSHQVSISFLEIYNNVLYDLLDKSNEPSLAFNPKTKSTIILNATEVMVSSEEEAIALLNRGCRGRTIGSTKMNSRATRVHTIFKTSLKSTDSDNPMITSSLYLIDLAAEGKVLEEADHINKSLTVLGRLISTVKKGKVFASYRENLLTYLLKDSIGGNCLTAALCCLRPSFENLETSKRTLEFAKRLCFITNQISINSTTDSQLTGTVNAKVNEVLDDRALLNKYEKDIKQLKEKNLEKENLLDDLKVQLDILKQHASEGGKHLLDCQSKEQEIATTTSKLSAEVHF